MLTFETVNELSLKVTCSGSDTLFVKAGDFIAEIEETDSILHTVHKGRCFYRRRKPGRKKLSFRKTAARSTEQPDAGSPRFPDKTRHP